MTEARAKLGNRRATRNLQPSHEQCGATGQAEVRRFDEAVRNKSNVLLIDVEADTHVTFIPILSRHAQSQRNANAVGPVFPQCQAASSAIDECLVLAIEIPLLVPIVRDDALDPLSQIKKTRQVVPTIDEIERILIVL